jgi:hypothetical protein
VKVPTWWIEVLRDASASAHQFVLIVLAEQGRHYTVVGSDKDVTQHQGEVQFFDLILLVREAEIRRNSY